MWDITGLSLKPPAGPEAPYGCHKAALAGFDSCYDYMLWFRPVCWERNYVSKTLVGSTGGRSGNLDLCGKRSACT
jgi:hypothetical protein